LLLPGCAAPPEEDSAAAGPELETGSEAELLPALPPPPEEESSPWPELETGTMEELLADWLPPPSSPEEHEKVDARAISANAA